MGIVVASGGAGGVVDGEDDTGDLEGARFDEVAGAVAEFGELEVGVAGKCETGGHEHGVNFDATGAGKFEVELGGLVSLYGAGEDPAAAGEQGSGKKAGETFGVAGAEGGEAEDPGRCGMIHAARVVPVLEIARVGHTRMIGWRRTLVQGVRRWN